MADPYAYLEEVEGDKALQWVKDQNSKTEMRLGKDARLKEFEDIFSIAEKPKAYCIPAFL